MPVHASVGHLPSQNVMKTLTQEDMRKLYFRTMASTEHAGRRLPAEDAAENYGDVHDMGKRNGKYMKYQQKRAPLVDRSACRYSRDFITLPLGDNICNGQLAASFKQGLGSGGKGVQAPMLAKSSYMADFPEMNDKQLKAAKQGSCRPEQARTQTIGGTGDMLEVQSHVHQKFAPPPTGLELAGKILIPKPNLSVGMNIGEPPRTSYKSEFGRSAQNMMKSGSAPQLNTLGIPVDIGNDDEMFQVRRACFLSPGQ